MQSSVSVSNSYASSSFSVCWDGESSILLGAINRLTTPTGYLKERLKFERRSDL